MESSPTYQQALEFCNEWMQQNHPEMRPFNMKIGTEDYGTTQWSNDKFEYFLSKKIKFSKSETDLLTDTIFFISVPPTKDEFFTVLRILDK